MVLAWNAAAEGTVAGSNCMHMVCRYNTAGNYIGNSATDSYGAQRNVQGGRSPGCASFQTLMNYTTAAFGPVGSPPPPAPTGVAEAPGNTYIYMTTYVQKY